MGLLIYVSHLAVRTAHRHWLIDWFIDWLIDLLGLTSVSTKKGHIQHTNKNFAPNFHIAVTKWYGTSMVMSVIDMLKAVGPVDNADYLLW